MKAYLTLFLSVLFTIAIASLHDHDPEQRLFLLASDTTVRVHIEDVDNGIVIKGSGSGFAIQTLRRPLVFITNAHVCHSETSKLSVDFKNNNILTGSEFNVKVIKFDRLYDLCAMTLKDDNISGYIKTLKINKEPLAQGERIYVNGYPVGEDLTPSVGMVVGYGNRLSPFWVSLIMSNRVYPGNSGSPIMNSLGEVVGVVEAADRLSYQGYGIPGEYLDQFVESL